MKVHTTCAANLSSRYIKKLRISNYSLKKVLWLGGGEKGVVCVENYSPEVRYRL